MATNTTPGPWLIWSDEHRQWWRVGSKGYTGRVEEAGRYSFAESLLICRGANRGDDWTRNRSGPTDSVTPDEVMVPSPEMISAIEQKE